MWMSRHDGKECLFLGSKRNPSSWFELGLVKKVGYGLSTSFWEDSWLGIVLLKIIFQRLFSISQLPKGLVDEVKKCL